MLYNTSSSQKGEIALRQRQGSHAVPAFKAAINVLNDNTSVFMVWSIHHVCGVYYFQERMGSVKRYNLATSLAN